MGLVTTEQISAVHAPTLFMVFFNTVLLVLLFFVIVWLIKKIK